MDTQCWLLVWICFLTPLDPSCCCRNNQGNGYPASDADGSEIAESWFPQLQGALFAVNCYARHWTFQDKNEAQESSTCGYTDVRQDNDMDQHPLLSEDNISHSSHLSTELWAKFTTLLTKVFPLLFNLGAWLMVVWMFRGQKATSASPRIQDHEKLSIHSACHQQSCAKLTSLKAEDSCTVSQSGFLNTSFPVTRNESPGTKSSCDNHMGQDKEFTENYVNANYRENWPKNRLSKTTVQPFTENDSEQWVHLNVEQTITSSVDVLPGDTLTDRTNHRPQTKKVYQDITKDSTAKDIHVLADRVITDLEVLDGPNVTHSVHPVTRPDVQQIEGNPGSCCRADMSDIKNAACQNPGQHKAEHRQLCQLDDKKSCMKENGSNEFHPVTLDGVDLVTCTEGKECAFETEESMLSTADECGTFESTFHLDLVSFGTSRTDEVYTNDINQIQCTPSPEDNSKIPNPTDSTESLPEWTTYNTDDTDHTGAELCEIDSRENNGIDHPIETIGESSMAKFHSFCRRLLDTSSFLESENPDERFAPIERQMALIDDVCVPGSEASVGNVSTAHQESLISAPLSSSSTQPSLPWTAICMADPKGKLEAVPLFYDLLLSSCDEIVFECPTWPSTTSAAAEAVCASSATVVDADLAREGPPTVDGERDPHESTDAIQATECSAYVSESDYTHCIGKKAARGKGPIKVPEIPMDLEFVYMSCKTEKLVPVKDFIKILETCYLGMEAKKSIVSQQYVIAREKCCLDWIEAIRNRGKKILPKWWLHRNLRVEGLESNKCRKRREWLEKKQAQALEEQTMRERRDLLFLGSKPDIDVYLDEPTGAENLLFQYEEDGTPSFSVEQYFAAVSQGLCEDSGAAVHLADLNQGLPSRWQGVQLADTSECSPEAFSPKQTPPENAWGEPRTDRNNPQPGRMTRLVSSYSSDKTAQNGSGDSLYDI